jgi:hypothetical protein
LRREIRQAPNGESFNDLVIRLDRAIDMPMNHDAPTDEING